MLSPEGIKREKGEGIKVEKRFVPLIESSPKVLSLNGEGDKTDWICKWLHHNNQEKGKLRKDQEVLMGNVLNIQPSIGRGGIYEGGKNQVGTIWEVIGLAKKF